MQIEHVSLVEQVREAMATYLAAHESAEIAAAALADSKRRIGSNEAERKEAKAKMPPDIYEAYTAEHPDHERKYKATAAHLERSEKELNVLRELLQREAADVHMQAAERYHQAVTIADTTAMRYQAMPANHTSTAEYRARYGPVAGNGIKRATVAADDDAEASLPF